MADLSGVFGGPWSPPPEKVLASPEDQLRQAIIDAGLTPPAEIVLDGKIHRFNSGTKGTPGKDVAGYYIAYADGVPAGAFGCWRQDIRHVWRADIGRKLTASEEMANVRRMAELKAMRDEELKRSREIISDTVERIWADCMAAHPDHPYLSRKGIGVHGARVTGDGRLVLPLFDMDGTLSTLQYIDHEGGKLYHSGGATGAKFWMIGSMDDPGVLYIAEGFATAATIHEVTSRPVVVAYSASNLVPVTGLFREKYGSAQNIVIVADNDQSGVGQRYAEQACAKFGARMVMPPVLGDANDYAQAGNDLASLLNPPVEDWLIPADSFCEKPAPISWLVKHWLQDRALIMVHGPSGGGKTFVVLDWCLRMASGTADWMGQKVKPGNIIYLAGEGHHGLRSRVAAWKYHHQAKHLTMWLSKDGCDLNTPQGYMKVSEQIQMLQQKPQMIVVDTLHRFLQGDENSAQDAKTMLDACNSLMNQFDCSVLLVHHTGVSDEAQHRARGSSAWRGALDIEISVVPSKDNAPMELIQRKSKDAEIAKNVYVELKQVTIPGWLDEDNEPVTSAVIIEADAPKVQDKKESAINKHVKLFENAWWASGAEVKDDAPYLSRSALLNYLIQHQNISEASAKVYIKPSANGKLIADLLLAEIISAHEHGWIVIDSVQASAMLMRKNDR